MNQRRVNQPIGTFTEPDHLAKPLEDHDFTRTFIKASANPNEAADSAFWQAARSSDRNCLALDPPKFSSGLVQASHDCLAGEPLRGHGGPASALNKL